MSATITDTTETDVTYVASPPSDERIMHRGPLRRLMISPEIGALIGAVVVWLFLWGNGETFGTAGTTLNWLDVAAPPGIMAMAIALLMIGGEFDLSSGVMTGASAMIIGLMSRYFAGGMNIGYAILAAFLAAGAIGWFNGYMVNKTGLPSFIITLASFFTMRGLMLVLSKRLNEKVYVDEILDQKGANVAKNWIAHEWKLKEFTGRDALYVGLVIVGVSLIAIGLLEQSFIRRTAVAAKNAFVFAIGLAIAIGGFSFLLNSDGVVNNFVGAGMTALGAIMAIVGLALTFWESSNCTDVAGLAKQIRPSSPLRIYLGLLGIVLACVIPIPFGRDERQAVLSWAPSPIRVVIVAIAALAGAFFAVRSMTGRTGSTSLKESFGKIGLVKPLLFAAYSGLVVVTLTVSILQLSTVQAMRAVGMMVLGTGGIALLLTSRGRAGKSGQKLLQLLLGCIAALALVVFGLISRADSTATRFHTVLPAVLTMAAALLVANSLLEFLMQKRTFGRPAADRLAARLQILGGVLAVVGGAIRVLFTNFTPEHAKALADAGEPVPQNVLRQTVVWWLLVTAIGAYVLIKTRWGNWIFAVGGNKDASRAIGVPANKVKISLFVLVSLCGALAGTLHALRYGTVQADQGTGLEFEYIIAAVVGGCLMTGGYGSVIGAGLGGAILAMSTTGIQTVAGWNGDVRYAFLGGVLLVAVLVNTYIRKKALEAR
jgi:ribose/xylose/arabinose/galactoside ABC-type transport system permease subunit